MYSNSLNGSGPSMARRIAALYAMLIVAAPAGASSLTGTTSPVPVTLTIGNDSGATTATALFFH